MSQQPSRKLKLQLWVVALLVILPVVMIVLNGYDAIQGILWSPGASGDVQAIRQSRDELNVSELAFGIYKPGAIADSAVFDMQHIYIDWRHGQYDSLVHVLSKMESRDIRPVLTVEPWARDSLPLFQSILNGRYDTELDKLISFLSVAGDTIILSWGHEMDQDLTTRYDWSNRNAKEYTEAFRYVHEYIEERLDLPITWVWAPVGKPDADRFWPGDEYVDMIGLPVYSFPQWDRSYHGHMRSFYQNFQEKYQYVAPRQKPVMIIEFGVTGSEDYQAYWLSEGFRDFASFPLLAGVVFFMAQDTEGAWGDSLPTPDWRMDPDLLNGMVTWYRQQYNSD